MGAVLFTFSETHNPLSDSLVESKSMFLDISDHEFSDILQFEY